MHKVQTYLLALGATMTIACSDPSDTAQNGMQRDTESDITSAADTSVSPDLGSLDTLTPIPDIVATETISGMCGDGNLDPGEECDEGDNNSDTSPDACRTTCKDAFCGDGVWDTGEVCDDGNEDDADTCTTLCQAGPVPSKPMPGQVIFTELMVNPDRVTDPMGEWVEVQNTTHLSLNLSECSLGDNGNDLVDLGSEGTLVIPPKGTLVFAFEGNPQLNGGAPADLAYKTLLLDNSFDEVILTCEDQIIDDVSYTPLFGPLKQGHALALSGSKSDTQLNDASTSWCNSQIVFGAGDFGTPEHPILIALRSTRRWTTAPSQVMKQ